MFTELDNDFWSDESFEDAITRGFVALYETEIAKEAKGKHFSQIDNSYLERIRRSGIFIPAPDRIIDGYSIDGIDGIPFSGCMSFGEAKKNDQSPDDLLESYCRVNAFRKVDRFPSGVKRTCNGDGYECVSLWPQNFGPMDAVKFYCVLNNGKIHLAKKEFGSTTLEDKLKFERTLLYSMQIVADSKHTWSISANDGRTKVSVGAYRECVKSLLYARQLPMTATGRKRPILHLVQAHKRRMKEGIDVDIEQFLRGVDEVVMDGTKFKVLPPKKFFESMKQKN
jgi:hypothetical protein